MIMHKSHIPLSFMEAADSIVIDGKESTIDDICMRCKLKLVCRIANDPTKSTGSNASYHYCKSSEIDFPIRPFKGDASEIKDIVHLAYVLQVSTKTIVYFLRHHDTAWRKKLFKQKNGKIRELYIPTLSLKDIHKKINFCILDRAQKTLDTRVTGFIKGRDIVSNASAHCDKPIVMNVDIKDFFYSIPSGKVFNVFNKDIGFTKYVSYVLTRLCTHRNMVPPGAPTSPALSNLVCKRMDSQLVKMASKLSLTYTRYADDLTFSGLSKDINPIRIVNYINNIAKHNGFTLNPEKVRIMRSGRRQEVTGVVVNKHPNMSRHKYLKLRAEVHHAAEKSPEEISVIKGKVAFLSMVNKNKGKKLKNQLNQILEVGA